MTRTDNPDLLLVVTGNILYAFLDEPDLLYVDGFDGTIIFMRDGSIRWLTHWMKIDGPSTP